MKRIFPGFLTAILLLAACAQQTPMQSADPIEVPSGMTWQEQYDLGMRYLSEGNYTEAIIAFTAAIEIDPKQAPAYVGRGQAYIFSGETGENLAAAQADYERAIELDDTNLGAYLGLADVYIRRGDYEGALEILREGREKVENEQSIAEKIVEIEAGTIRDSSGRTLRVNHYSETGELNFYSTLTYGDDGKVEREDVFSSDGVLTSYHLHYYNVDNLSSYSETYTPDGTCVFKNETIYDESGKWLYDVSFNARGEESSRNEAQYADNILIGINRYSNGVLIGYSRYEDGHSVEYDASGNITGYSEGIATEK